MAILFGTTFVIGICVYMACSRNFIKTIFIKFIGKWMDLENIIRSEVTQSQKNSHDMHSLISGYY